MFSSSGIRIHRVKRREIKGNYKKLEIFCGIKGPLCTAVRPIMEGVIGNELTYVEGGEIHFQAVADSSFFISKLFVN